MRAVEMQDEIFQRWLAAEAAQGEVLAARSGGRLTLKRLDDGKFLAAFSCCTACRFPNDRVHTGPLQVLVGLRFPEDYMARPYSSRDVIHLLGPAVWHPNVLGHAVCLHLRLAQSLESILWGMWSLLSYQNFSSHHPLNPAAAAWAVRNASLFPLTSESLTGATLARRTPHV